MTKSVWAWLFLWASVILWSLLLLSGCALLNGVTRVEVPVSVACNPPHIDPPARPIDSVAPQANEFEFVRALWATLETLEGYTQHLEAAVDACRG